VGDDLFLLVPLVSLFTGCEADAPFVFDAGGGVISVVGTTLVGAELKTSKRCMMRAVTSFCKIV
jgi:hypothetical protein